MTEKNPFHLVDPSPWPLVTATGIFIAVTGGVVYMHGGEMLVLILGLCLMVVSIGMWFRDVVREGSLEGQHTSMVQVGLRVGMMLFIVSEVMFFVAFFWAFFWGSLSPVVGIGAVWPPEGISVMDIWEIPFLNTLLLLASGGSVTWAHHSMVAGKRSELVLGLSVTVALAVVFTGLQFYEYIEAGFTVSDGIYGSIFYMATGFHGFHVMIGTLVLSISLLRVLRYEVTKQHHFGFEGGAWYWHFVDVVWLFLFVSVYWWGGLL